MNCTYELYKAEIHLLLTNSWIYRKLKSIQALTIEFFKFVNNRFHGLMQDVFKFNYMTAHDTRSIKFSY